MITCKDFLSELNDYLDESASPELRRELEQHLNDCPNCWVVCDTTKKTIQIYRGMETHPIPAEVHNRLMVAIQKKTQA